MVTSTVKKHLFIFLFYFCYFFYGKTDANISAALQSRSKAVCVTKYDIKYTKSEVNTLIDVSNNHQYQVYLIQIFKSTCFLFFLFLFFISTAWSITNGILFGGGGWSCPGTKRSLVMWHASKPPQIVYGCLQSRLQPADLTASKKNQTLLCFIWREYTL